MESVTGDECFRKLDLEQHVLFYFAAGWCKPCQEAGPIVEELIKEYDSNKIKFFKVDNPKSCLVAFKSNNLTGMFVFLFIFSFTIS